MRKLLAFVFIFLFAWHPARADTTTTHYAFTAPSIGNTTNWGLSLNSNFASIDSNLWLASQGTVIGVDTATSASNITLTNPLDNIQNIAFTTTNKKLILPPMNASSSLVIGGTMTVFNAGANALSVVAQDGTTSLVSSLSSGQTVYITLLTNGTANGTFQVSGPYIGAVGNLPLGTSVSAANPSVSGDVTTGFYSAGASQVDIAAAGAQAVAIGTTGMKVVNGVGIGTNNPSSGLIIGAGSLNVAGLTASQLVATDGSKNLTSTISLPNGTTAATQTAGSNDTKVATDAYIDRGASGASEVLIAAQTASSSSTVVFSGIPSGYDKYELVLTSVTPGNAGDTLRLQVGAATTTYTWNLFEVSDSALTGTHANTSDSSWIFGFGGVGTTSAIGLSGTIDVYGLSSSKEAVMSGLYSYWSGSNFYSVTTSGRQGGANGPFTSLTLSMSTGTIASGTFALYGIRKQ